MPIIRKATDSDLNAIVSIHISAFRGFFLSMLGDRFLRELYHGFLLNVDSIFLVSVHDGFVTGFAVGAVNPGGFFHKLLKDRWFYLLVGAIPGLLRHPIVVGRKLLSALIYRGDQPPQTGVGALLSSLAVAPAFAKSGIGESLVKMFIASAKQIGATHVYLTTDRFQNESVNRFYIRQGFKVECSFVKAGKREMNRYILYIESESQ